MSEVLDDSAKKGIRLAVEAGWMLAEAYAGLQKGEAASHGAADQGPDQGTRSDKARDSICPETLTEALDLQSGAGSTTLLRAGAAAQELAALLHLGAESDTCIPNDPQGVLAYTQHLLDSLVRSGDSRAREAFRLGVSLAELMTAPADKLRDRFKDVGEAHRRLELLADGFEPGVADSVSACLADWKKLLDKPSTDYMDQRFVPQALVKAQADTARMWKALLFGPGLSIGYEKQQLTLGITASIVGPALKWGAPILLLLVFGFLTLKVLSGTGSIESRIAVAILALVSLVASAAGPLGQKAKDFWQKYYRQTVDATMSSSLIHDRLEVPVKKAEAEASDDESKARSEAIEREREERAKSRQRSRNWRQAKVPAPAESDNSDRPSSPDAAGESGSGDAGCGGEPAEKQPESRRHAKLLPS
jgi:hypothetical protein